MSEIIPSISAIIAALSVITASAFAIKQMRNADRSRRSEFILKMQSVFLDKQYREAWAKVRNKPHKTYDECRVIRAELEIVCGFFDSLGFLLAKKLVEPDVVFDMFGSSIIRAWKRCEVYINGARESINDEKLNESFEFLYKEALRRQGSKG